MQCSLQLNEARNSEACEPTTNSIEPQPIIASPCWSAVDCDSHLVLTKPTRVHLNLEDLKCFEVVERQFHHYGISFRNAIALQPSNPAYPPRSSATLLMGAPKSGWLEVIFSQPVSMFCSYITSSQRTIVSAYDSEDNLLSRASITESNLADSDSQIPPNAQLQIQTPNISHITFYAFDGQLTVTDLSFSFQASVTTQYS